MKDEDVRIGMKVVPHDKTATGWGELSSSNHWRVAQEEGQPFLFVSSQCTNAFDKAPVWVLGKTQDIDGDLFNASDFEPYAVKPRRKELRAEIERLKHVVDTLKSENAALYCYRSDAIKELAAKDAEIAALKKQDASEKPELLPVGTRVMVDYVKDIYAATIIKVDGGDPIVPYRVRYYDGQERWVQRRRVTVIPTNPPDLLPVGTRVRTKDFFGNDHTGVIKKIDLLDKELPYLITFDDDDGIKHWRSEAQLTLISPEDKLLPVGTRVMLTGTIINVDEKDDEYPYGVVIDGDVDAWYPKQSVKPINHD